MDLNDGYRWQSFSFIGARTGQPDTVRVWISNMQDAGSLFHLLGLLVYSCIFSGQRSGNRYIVGPLGRVCGQGVESPESVRVCSTHV